MAKVVRRMPGDGTREVVVTPPLHESRSELLTTVCLGEVRWVSVRGFPVRDSDGSICRLVGTVQDITAQKQAEEQVAKNLALAESAWAESEALRKATLALTQDLRMDIVLDALLQSLTEIVSCECACIWLLEGDTRLFVAREKLRHETPKKTPDYPLTLNAVDIPFLH